MKIKVPGLEELFKADVHLGHQVRRWNPKAEPFIYSSTGNIHIINLEETRKNLKAACEFLYATAKEGKQIVFVGTKRQASELLKLEVSHCGALYVNRRWLGGTLTNYHVVKKNIDKLVSMRKKRETGEYEVYTKKEKLLLDRTIEKLENSVGGLVGIRGLPAALVVIDGRREKTAVREGQRKNIPVVALVDTDTDPTGIDFPIPGNDDAIKSISLILKTLAGAVERGYEDYEKGVKSEDQAESKESKESKGEDSPGKTPKVTKKVSKKAPKTKTKKVKKAKKESTKLK